MKSLDTRYGSLCVPDASNDLIEKFLVAYGEWAYDEVRFVAAALAREGARVLDVGAFVGTFGLGLAAEKEISSLVFVEANPVVAKALRKNIELLVHTHGSVIEAAVVPHGVALQGHYEESNLGSLSFVCEHDKNRILLDGELNFVNLLDVYRDHGGFDLIKMDVEGLEYLILKSAPSLLLPGGPTFWLECNEGLQSLALVDLLLESGFNVHYFAFPAYVSNNFLGQTDQIFPCAYESGLWASRSSAPLLSKILVEHACILKPILSREDLRIALWQTPRWGMATWLDATPALLTAEAAHAVLGMAFDDFLVLPPSSSHQNQQESSTEVAILKAEIRAMRIVLDDAEKRLGKSDRALRSLEAVEMLAVQFEAVARGTKIELDRLTSIEKSSYWKVAVELQAFLTKHPKIRKTLRALLASAHAKFKR